MLQGVITGVKYNQPVSSDDFVREEEGVDLISTLFTQKKLMDSQNSLE
jgi:hypothetical protein